MRKPIYLPSDYKNRTRTVIKGRARSGEISPKGIVAETEDWEGRIKADVGPAAVRYVFEDGKFRRMTLKEQVAKGYFYLGRGPTGIRTTVKEGINVKR